MGRGKRGYGDIVGVILVVTESLSFFKMFFALDRVSAVVRVRPPTITWYIFLLLSILYTILYCVCVLLCCGADIAGGLLVTLGFFSFFIDFFTLHVVGAVVQVRAFLLSIFSIAL